MFPLPNFSIILTNLIMESSKISHRKIKNHRSSHCLTTEKESERKKLPMLRVATIFVWQPVCYTTGTAHNTFSDQIQMPGLQSFSWTGSYTLGNNVGMLVLKGFYCWLNGCETLDRSHCGCNLHWIVSRGPIFNEV